MTSILQQRSLQLRLVDLCFAMDLISFVTEDGVLCVHRSISWEKVYEKKCADINHDQNDRVVSIKFSPNGRYLAVAFGTGGIYLLDIEYNHIGEMFKIKSGHKSHIISICWSELPGSASVTLDDPLFLKAGPDNLFDHQAKDEKMQNHLRLLSGLNNSILFSLSKSGELNLYAYGTYLVWSVSLVNSYPNLSCQSIDTFEVTFSSASSSLFILIGDKMEKPLLQEEVAVELPSNVVKSWSTWQRLAYLHILLDFFLKKAEETVVGLGRKWKDCNKIIPAKLTLLQSIITGYEMKLTPIQLYHTISMCGLWHPATTTSFSSHWNDQGITRYRTTFGLTAKLLLRTLQFKIIPLLTSIFLICKEYQELLRKNDVLVNPTHDEAISQQWKTIEANVIYALFATENALVEGKYARESMNLYIQFVKDCYLEASSQGTDTAVSSKYTGPDLELREKCQVLFDHREDRPPATIPEHVTGTHWFAHFQDYALAAGAGTKASLLNIHNIGKLLRATSSHGEDPFENGHVFEDSLSPAASRRLEVIEEIVQLLLQDKYPHLQLSLTQPLYLHNQLKKLSQAVNQLPGLSQLLAEDQHPQLSLSSSVFLPYSHNTDRVVYSDSTIISCKLSLTLKNEEEGEDDDDEGEEMALGSGVWWVRSLVVQQSISSHYLCLLISSLDQSNQRETVYVAKIPLVHQKGVHWVTIYDRIATEPVIDLLHATTPSLLISTATTNQPAGGGASGRSEWSVLISSHNPATGNSELRKYPFSSMKFHTVTNDADQWFSSDEIMLSRVSSLPLGSIEEDSIDMIVSQLQRVIAVEEISTAVQSMSAPRGVVCLSDQAGKVVLVDVETVEEEEEEDEEDDEEDEEEGEGEVDQSLNESS